MGRKERKMEHAIVKFQQELEEKRKEGKWNVIFPTTTFQTPGLFYEPVMEELKIDPDPKNKEVYKLSGTTEFAFHHSTLQRIGFAAGLIWNAKGCLRTDDGTNPNIVQYKAEGAVRKEDGSYILLNADYLYDLSVIEEELNISYSKKFDELPDVEKKKSNRDKWIGDKVKRDMIQNRKFRLQKAQAGAMSRVIRKIIGLKNSYSAEDLKKPFIIPRIVFRPDINDPKIRSLLLRQGLEATTILFGSSDRTLIDHSSREIVDITPQTAEPLPPEETPQEESSTPGKTTDDPLKPLHDLMKRKGYDIKKLTKPLEQYSPGAIEKFKANLEALPDVEEEIPM